MTRLLPSVLFRLSQVAATLTMALPVLEFLSSLIPIPSLYSAFVEREYLSVVAIALPYTNHEKYRPYVIAMAHRVIAQWFVACRVHYRPTVARYINKTLTTDLNVTSRRPIGSQMSDGGRASIGHELMEVCQDMMARYTYSNLSTLPSRSSGAEFLVAGGPSKTWIVANSLVTITTSGQGGGRSATCTRCSSNRTVPRPPVEAPPIDLLSSSNQLCSCWCRGWAEIKIRRPSGNVSWLMRVQNRLSSLHLSQLPSQRLESPFGLVSLNLPATERSASRTTAESAKLPSSPVLEVDKKECVSVEVTPATVVESVHVTEGEAEHEATGNKEMLCKSHDLESPHCHDNESVLPGEHLDQEGVNSVEGVANLEEGVANSCAVSADKSPKSPSKTISSGPAPSEHHHTSQSWSGDAVEMDAFPLSPKPSSYSTHFPLELLPPLLSYDEIDENSGRSPRLHGNSEVLSEEEQLTLHASMSDIATSQSDQSEDDSDTPTGSPVDEPDMLSTSSEEESDVHCLSTNPTPLPRPSPQPLKPQLVKQNSLPTQQTSEDLSSTPLRKLSTPFHPTARSVTPTVASGDSSPSLSRRPPLVYTPHTTGGVSDPVQNGMGTAEESELYNDPSFIFLQLYGCCVLADPEDRPRLLQNNDVTERALKVLDHIPPYDTHKLGVVYVGHGQTSESEILANTFGSSRYIEFLRGLGPLLRLQDVPRNMVYLGGLDQSGPDGQFTYCYHDDITQVIFHVATLMPTDLTSDPQCSNKKLHIGNDYVVIVYNDSGSKYNFGTIKGHFNFVEVLVEPLGSGMNRVSVRAKRGMEQMLDSRPFVISDQWLPVLVRLKALQANLASLVHVCETTTASPTERYLSNWLGRLRQINRIREKQNQDLIAKQGSSVIDFTYYS